MAKSPVRCPFNGKLCIECTLYRGRHYYLCNCEHYRGYIKPNNKVNTDIQPESLDFNKIKGLLDPWSTTSNTADENELEIKLKLFDVENSKETIYDLKDAKMWTWDDPSIMRVIAGTHINSWEKLLEIARYSEEKGLRELIIREAPRFMLLAGG
jgi:hypothetical protein